MRLRTRSGIALVLLLSAVCLGATNIDPVLKYVWGENIGWVTLRDAGADGIRVHATFLAGYAWGENVGWINLGAGRPTNGTAYANVNNTDFGVNIDPITGNLFGLAWGENIGWINFDTLTALGGSGKQARLDTVANRFRGYAWGENVGWINLDDSVRFAAYVPTACYTPFADKNGDGDVDQDDFAAFQLCYSGNGIPAPDGCECFDRDKDNDVDSNDLTAFSNCGTGPSVSWSLVLTPNCSP